MSLRNEKIAQNQPPQKKSPAIPPDFTAPYPPQLCFLMPIFAPKLPYFTLLFF
jgi:hypothetical protein